MGVCEGDAKETFRKPASLVALVDRQFLVQQLFIFFGMKRFDNIKELKAGMKYTEIQGTFTHFMVFLLDDLEMITNRG